ncbi:hypothetical protein C9374_005090 [Naegleria lovaniensis]|uniref:Sodium/calcium exchanger membrane region domain-containing protein n=1 Tax=Naegleria lovaniensis TaxID=51637 RepID=A0AA88GLN4_NAELO|nr:uncharacterized protein C9374_005090 [Naegleria lovaniensis]KAG2382510.1 hypothetical protein C9374_005090 [Naegleria lovaniensis]
MRIFPHVPRTSWWYVVKYSSIAILVVLCMILFKKNEPTTNNNNQTMNTTLSDEYHSSWSTSLLLFGWTWSSKTIPIDPTPPPQQQQPLNIRKYVSTTRSTSSHHLLRLGHHHDRNASPHNLYHSTTTLTNTTTPLITPSHPLNFQTSSPLVGDDDGNTKICHKIANYELDQCEFVQENCPNPMGGGMINYLNIRYCGLKNVSWLFFVLSICWILVLFFMLSNTAEVNFCPALTEICRILRLSPDVAGVTFLSLGNGAPDISSIIAGVFSGSTGFGVGEPIGAGVFVTSMVMSAVSLFSNAKVIPFPFLRDSIAYLISVSYVMFMVIFNGSINLWQSIVCLLIYGSYVSFVILSRTLITCYQRYKRKNKNIGVINDDEYDSDEVQDGGDGWKIGKAPNFEMQINKISDLNEFVKKEIIEEQKHNFFGTVFYPKVGMVHVHKKHHHTTTSETFTSPRFDQDEIPSNSSVLAKTIPKKEKITIDTSIPSNSTLLSNQILNVGTSSSSSSSNSTNTTNRSAKRTIEFTGSLIINEHFATNHNTTSTTEPHEETSLLSNDSRKWKATSLYLTLQTKFKDFLEYFLDWIEWEEKSLFSKIFFVLFEGWTLLIRNLTIPKADPEDWSKFFACVSMIFMPPFAVFATGYVTLTLPNSSFPVWALTLLIGCVFSLIVFFTSRRGKPPRYHFIFVFLAFIMSILWIYIIANEMVDLLTSLGVILQVSDAILSITVLSWGNSLSDLVADVLIARQGFVEMALGGIYGGPLLNLLIGLGIAATSSNILNGTPFVFEKNTTVYASFFFLIASLSSALIVVPLCRWHSPKIFGLFLGSLYLSYMIFSALVEMKIIFHNR